MRPEMQIEQSVNMLDKIAMFLLCIRIAFLKGHHAALCPAKD